MGNCGGNCNCCCECCRDDLNHCFCGGPLPWMDPIEDQQLLYPELDQSTNIHEYAIIGIGQDGAALGLGHKKTTKRLNIIPNLNSFLNRPEFNTGIVLKSSGHSIIIASNGYETILASPWIECAESQNLYITEVNYFKQRDIRIKEISTNPLSGTIYWISTTNELYSTSFKDKLKDKPHATKINDCPGFPKNITIIDAKSNVEYGNSLLLCYSHDTELVAQSWYRGLNFNQILPGDVRCLIGEYCRQNKVYATMYSENGGNGISPDDPRNCKKNKSTWTEVQFPEQVNIVKIATAIGHSLFLDDHGRIWTCGNNGCGGCGFDREQYKEIQEPTIVN